MWKPTCLLLLASVALRPTAGLETERECDACLTLTHEMHEACLRQVAHAAYEAEDASFEIVEEGLTHALTKYAWVHPQGSSRGYYQNLHETMKADDADALIEDRHQFRGGSRDDFFVEVVAAHDEAFHGMLEMCATDPDPSHSTSFFTLSVVGCSAYCHEDRLHPGITHYPEADIMDEINAHLPNEAILYGLVMQEHKDELAAIPEDTFFDHGEDGSEDEYIDLPNLPNEAYPDSEDL